MSRGTTRRNKVKVLVAMSVAVVLGSLGDIMLGHGVRMLAEECRTAWCAFSTSLGDAYIWGGVILLLGFFALYLASLSWADLSFVLPLTAGEYIVVTILAYFVLNEHILDLRWAGSVLVATGIALVTRS